MLEKKSFKETKSTNNFNSLILIYCDSSFRQVEPWYDFSVSNLLPSGVKLEQFQFSVCFLFPFFRTEDSWEFPTRCYVPIYCQIVSSNMGLNGNFPWNVFTVWAGEWFLMYGLWPENVRSLTLLCLLVPSTSLYS